MSGAGVDEVHLADAALVLLEGRDLLRVGRPDEDRAVAPRPAGVVGGVAEVLHAVGGELRFPARRDVAHPEVLVADERGQAAVGRRDVGPDRRTAAPARHLFRLRIRGRACRRRQIARPAFRADREGHRAAVGGEVERRERQMRPRVGRSRRRGQRGGELRLVERRAARLARRIDQHELGPVGRRRAVPEATVGEPGRTDPRVEDERRRVVGHERLGAGVVVVREHTRLRLSGRHRRESGQRRRGGAETEDVGHGCARPPGQDDTTRPG